MDFKSDNTRTIIIISRFIYGFVFCVLLAGLITVLSFDPADLLNLVGLKNQAKKIETLFLTPKRWLSLQLIIGGICIMWLFLGFISVRINGILIVSVNILQRIYFEVDFGLKQIVRHIKSAPLFLKIILFGLFVVMFISHIYEAIKSPLTYDEIWTYLNFSSRGPLVALAYYPAPNNHVLYSLASSFTVPFATLPEWGLRLPAVLTSALIFWLLFVLLLRYTSVFWAICGLLIFYSSYIVFYYSFLARGYVFQLFAFIGSLAAVLELVPTHSRYRTVAWLGLLCFSVYGLATIPTYVYPLATEFFILGIAIFSTKFNRLLFFKKIMIVGLLVTIIVVVFYTPILLLSGPKALFANKFVVPISRINVLLNLPSHLQDTVDWFFVSAFTKYIFISLTLVAIYAAFFKKKWPHRDLMLLLVLFIITPVVFMLMQSVIPFPRTWIYLIVVLVLQICWLLSQLYQSRSEVLNLSNYIILLIFLGIWSVSMYSSQIRFTQGQGYSLSFKKAYFQVAKMGVLPLVVDNDNGDVNMEFLHHIYHRPYSPIRNYTTSSLPAQILLVHDKSSEQLESIQPGSGGQRRIVYDDTFVRVSEITMPKYHH